MPHLRTSIAVAALALAAPILAQTLQVPGAPDPARITAGTYATDPAHTLIGWRVNHFGINDYFGVFGDATGTLTLDPANPGAASVEINVPVNMVTTANAKLTEHLGKADFFDSATHPTATFKSTSVTVDGTKATIAGDLTLRGVTKPVTLDAEFTGAGTNPFNKKETVGFHATTTIKRSDFGISYGVPVVSDEVALDISVAFEKQ